jgi:hypothetical protein
MYDPTIGRWLEQDPIGFKGGDANLYRYVRNDPANMTDPTGLFDTSPVEPVPGPTEYVYPIPAKGDLGGEIHVSPDATQRGKPGMYMSYRGNNAVGVRIVQMMYITIRVSRKFAGRSSAMWADDDVGITAQGFKKASPNPAAPIWTVDTSNKLSPAYGGSAYDPVRNEEWCFDRPDPSPILDTFTNKDREGLKLITAVFHYNTYFIFDYQTGVTPTGSKTWAGGAFFMVSWQCTAKRYFFDDYNEGRGWIDIKLPSYLDYGPEIEVLGWTDMPVAQLPAQVAAVNARHPGQTKFVGWMP